MHLGHTAPVWHGSRTSDWKEQPERSCTSGSPHSWHSSALAKRQTGLATRRGPRHANDGQIHAINDVERFLWGAVIIVLYTNICTFSGSRTRRRKRTRTRVTSPLGPRGERQLVEIGRRRRPRQSRRTISGTAGATKCLSRGSVGSRPGLGGLEGKERSNGAAPQVSDGIPWFRPVRTEKIFRVSNQRGQPHPHDSTTDRERR